MLIAGTRHECDDGVNRPVIRGEVLSSDGTWLKARFLVDTAADRTVFSADLWSALRLPPVVCPDRLAGVGGEAASVVVETQIRLAQPNQSIVFLRGQYAAVTELASLDMSILGRDITNLFAVIVDRPGDFVGLVGQWHRYVVQEA
jgi:hypothetical protein